MDARAAARLRRTQPCDGERAFLLRQRRALLRLLADLDERLKHARDQPEDTAERTLGAPVND